MLVTIRRALLSVSDKTGLVDFARALVARKVELLSTGGTARLLAEAGIPVTEVSSVHRLSRDHGRARQDAAPARAWRPAGAARHRRCRHGEARHPAHRSAGGEPVSVRGHRGQTGLHLRRRHREHRHRRPRDGACRVEEPRIGHRGRRSGRLRARAGRSRSQRRRHQHRHARLARRQGVRAHGEVRHHGVLVPAGPRGQGRGILPANPSAGVRETPGPALRRESAPAAPRSIASSAPPGPAWRRRACSRARSCRSTTSPTPTPRWSACACSTSPPASS